MLRMKTTPKQAREMLAALDLKQSDLAAEMAAITGKKYSPQTVNAWFRDDRGPSDACVVFLKMALRMKQAELRSMENDLSKENAAGTQMSE